MNYQVKTENFIGPIDALIYLFKKEEITPEEIKINQIIDDFVSFLHLLVKYDFEDAGEFVVFLATLIELKSKKILPQIKEETEEILNEETLQELMQLRLEEFTKFAEAAKVLRVKEMKMKEIFAGNPPLELKKLAGEKIKGANLQDLVKALSEVLNRQKNLNIEIIREEVTVEEKIQHLLAKIKNEKSGISFFDLFADNLNKREIIVTFLALLELIKLGSIYVIQDVLFGEIKIFMLEG